MNRILVTGAGGQIGSDLVARLRLRHGSDAVVATDIRPAAADASGPYERLDVVDAERLGQIVGDYGVGVVYHLASLLSARGEQTPNLAWDVNMLGLKHVLDLACGRPLRVFWPSSIAVFGPRTPRPCAPQHTILDPTTIYGVTKVSGELLCRYYAERCGVDVRSLRYPGIISYTAPPGGGTTDYAVDIFHAALRERRFTCFLRADTRLPMMYMPDALRATLALMEAPADRLTVRTSYNVAAFSFTAGELAEAIRRRLPGFTCDFAPDYHQAIADSWPERTDDAEARADWGWRPEWTLETMVDDMLAQLAPAHAPH